MFRHVKNTIKSYIQKCIHYNKSVERAGTGMFWRKRNKVESVEDKTVAPTPVAAPQIPLVDFTEAITDQEEHDTVAVIASAILSTSFDDATVKIKSIRRIDQDKEAAALIAASVLAHDKPESTFRLVSITEEGSN